MEQAGTDWSRDLSIINIVVSSQGDRIIGLYSKETKFANGT